MPKKRAPYETYADICEAKQLVPRFQRGLLASILMSVACAVALYYVPFRQIPSHIFALLVLFLLSPMPLTWAFLRNRRAPSEILERIKQNPQAWTQYQADVAAEDIFNKRIQLSQMYEEYTSLNINGDYAAAIRMKDDIDILDTWLRDKGVVNP